MPSHGRPRAQLLNAEGPAAAAVAADQTTAPPLAALVHGPPYGGVVRPRLWADLRPAPPTAAFPCRRLATEGGTAYVPADATPRMPHPTKALAITPDRSLSGLSQHTSRLFVTIRLVMNRNSAM